MKVESLFDDSPHIVVFGVAGARKTSLGVKIAEHYVNERVLYLSFGRENTKSASDRFPENAECFNFHSFAKRQLGIAHSRIVDRIDMSMLSRRFHELDLGNVENYLIESVSLLIEHYTTSGVHLTQLRKLMLHNDFSHLPREQKEQVAFLMTQFWINAFKLEWSVSHDMYLKEASSIATRLNYSILIVDECQDLNDAMYHWVNNMQANTPCLKSIKLGDPAQQIFSFLGASSRFLYEKPKLIMDRTYRFGADLASVVNDFVAKHALPYMKAIQSAPNTITAVNTYQSDAELLDMIKDGKRCAIVSQFNITLWQWMLKLTELDIKFHVLGKIHSHDQQQIKALHQLYHTGECRYPQWRNKDYQLIKLAAKEQGDKGLLLACRFIETLSYDKKGLFDRVMACSTPTRKGARVLLTTVHQAKGLDFSSVVVAADLPGDSAVSPLKASDVHRVYTTLTRAKDEVFLPYDYFKEVTKGA